MSYKISIDNEKKLIVQTLEGNPSKEEMMSAVEELKKAIDMFKPGEAKLLNNSVKFSVISPEVIEVMKEGQKLFGHFSKIATVSSSILSETQMKKSASQAGIDANKRWFKDVEEATKWLLE